MNTTEGNCFSCVHKIIVDQIVGTSHCSVPCSAGMEKVRSVLCVLCKG